MSAELNKVFCAILSAILVFLLSSFIGDLLYHPNNNKKKVSYSIEEEIAEETIINEKDINKPEVITLDTIENLLVTANLEEGESFVNKNCSACHSFEIPIKNKVGPSLANVMSRKVGSIEGYKYSKALKDSDKNWSYENLYLFLEKPKEWAPGTKMSYRGISKQENLANVLKYLAHISKLNES